MLCCGEEMRFGDKLKAPGDRGGEVRVRRVTGGVVYGGGATRPVSL